MNPEETASAPQENAAPARGFFYTINVVVVMSVLAFCVVLLGYALRAQFTPPDFLGKFQPPWGPLFRPLFVAFAVVGSALGRWRGWRWRSVNLRGMAAIVLVGGAAFALVYSQQRVSGANASIAGNLSQLSAASDQSYLEFGVDAITTLDELVGPENYLKGLNPVRTEDYRPLFPRRQGDPWMIIGLKGRTVRIEAGSEQFPVRNGVYRGRFEEVAYRDGIRHGPRRIFDHKRRLRAEAVFENGGVVGGAKIYAAAGKPAEEIADPVAAAARLEAELASVAGSAPP